MMISSSMDLPLLEGQQKSRMNMLVDQACRRQLDRLLQAGRSLRDG